MSGTLPDPLALAGLLAEPVEPEGSGLTRRESRYWRTTATTPPLGLAEQRVHDAGLA